MSKRDDGVNGCPTCGGSKVDPGGLGLCRTCGVKVEPALTGEQIAELRLGLGQIAVEVVGDPVKVKCCARIDGILARLASGVKASVTASREQALAALDEVIPPHLRANRHGDGFMGQRYETLRVFITGGERPCQDCGGAGLVDTSGFGDMATCEECRGRGTVGAPAEQRSADSLGKLISALEFVIRHSDSLTPSDIQRMQAILAEVGGKQ